ncbi:MAG: esterase family protein [Bacteroidetes bacterium]|nr:MAG: esterase family protein [Bacteroidota bacterium]
MKTFGLLSITLTLCAFLFTLSCQEPEFPQVSSGTLERIESFPSAFISDRNIDVWLPDGYSDSEKYAVLYMHDGQMLYDSTTTWNKQEWDVDGIMGRLIASNEIPPTIVVGIFNSPNRHMDYFPKRPMENLSEGEWAILDEEAEKQNQNPIRADDIDSDDYLKFIVEELKPHIDSKYSTKTDAANTFVAGSSMGGLISMYAICEYPEVFSGAACISTHWIGFHDFENNPIPAAFANYLENNLPDTSNHKIYFDFGTETLDAFYEPHQAAIDSVMIRNGFTELNWMTRKFPGEDHSENAWRKRLDIPVKFLLAE